MEFVMEKTAHKLDDKVDYFLHKIAMAPILTLDARALYEVEVLDEDSYLVDQVMLEKGLIKIVREARVITGKGLEISNFGGWSLYQKLLRKESQREYIESDKNLRRFEWENARLKNRVLEMEQQLKLSAQKERAAQELVSTLLKRNKTSKIIYVISGIAGGVALASIVWTVFAQ